MPSLLPEELIISIFHYLEPATLLLCRRVCKNFSKIITSDAGLVYKVELFADGMVNCEDCKDPISQRLSSMRERRQAWKELKTVMKGWKIGSQRWNAYELVDGIFAQTTNALGIHSSRGILFASLPFRDFSGSIMKYDDVGFSFRDFGMDPTQDLIAYLQCDVSPGDVMVDEEPNTVINIFLRTMSTNKPYKSAATEVLTITIPSDIQGTLIQIVDNVVGLMIWDDTSFSKLFIWNWMTGSLVVSETDSHVSMFDDYVFISNRAYAVSLPAPNSCFKLYTFDSSSGISATNPTTVCLRATLFSPAPPNLEASIFGIHTGPFTTPNSPPSCFRPSKPFTACSETRIHVAQLSLSLQSDELSTELCMVIIHNKTFLKQINRAELLNRPVVLPWDEWGVEGTAWIPGTTNSSWRYVHGERLARLYREGSSETRFLEIYDFGVPRGPPSWIPGDDYLSVYRSRQLLSAAFDHRVLFKLPCRLIRVTETQPYSGFMIDEDRLIGIKETTVIDDPPFFDIYTF